MAFVGLVPLLGAGPYLLSPQMRRCSYIVPLAFDRVLHRIRFRLYSRWRLHRFTVERAVATNRPDLPPLVGASTSDGEG